MDEIADNLVLNASGNLLNEGIGELRSVTSQISDVRTLQTAIIAALIRRYGAIPQVPVRVFKSANYIVGVVFVGADTLESLLPVTFKTFSAEPLAQEVTGAYDGKDNGSPAAPGPLESQFQLLSDRVAHIHAFVLSAR